LVCWTKINLATLAGAKKLKKIGAMNGSSWLGKQVTHCDKQRRHRYLIHLWSALACTIEIGVV
jgi:hypothetical protein